MPTENPQTEPPRQTAQPDAGRPVRAVVRRGRRRPITTGSANSRDVSTKLRLVGMAAPDMKPPTANPTPIRGATDPRWVLAVRTASVLEGTVLPPQKREMLMRAGKVMGLTPFDCSLILAIVQDRARRGIPTQDCPAAGESQLALIPLPRIRPIWPSLREKPGQVALLAAGMLALQALLLWVLLS